MHAQTRVDVNSCKCKFSFTEEKRSTHTQGPQCDPPTCTNISRHTKTHISQGFNLIFVYANVHVLRWCSVKTLVCGLLKSPHVETMDSLDLSPFFSNRMIVKAKTPVLLNLCWRQMYKDTVSLVIFYSIAFLLPRNPINRPNQQITTCLCISSLIYVILLYRRAPLLSKNYYYIF